MSSQENKAIARRYFEEIMNQGNMAVIDELISSNFVLNIPNVPQGIHGIQDFKDFVTSLRTAFPDVCFTVEREIAEESKAAIRWTQRGTQKGSLFGIPPTGKVVTDQGINIFHITDGKIEGVWLVEDTEGVMQQLGAIPTR